MRAFFTLIFLFTIQLSFAQKKIAIILPDAAEIKTHKLERRIVMNNNTPKDSVPYYIHRSIADVIKAELKTGEILPVIPEDINTQAGNSLSKTTSRLRTIENTQGFERILKVK